MSIVRHLLVSLFVVAAALATRGVRLRAFDMHQRSERYEDVYYLPPATWLPALSLGYTTALADLLWCRSLVYFGEEAGHRGRAQNAFSYTDAILSLDPDFQAPYQWAATVALYRPVAPTMEEAKLGLSYLERAVAKWPNDGRLRWEIGAYLRFNIAPLEKDKQRRQKLEEDAAMHLHLAMLKGEGPAWLALNNSTLLTKLGKKELAIRQLEEVYATIDDPDAREEIAMRIAQLRSETQAQAMRATIQDFEDQRSQSFPYLSPDMFMLVGGKVSERHRASVANRFAPAYELDPAP